MPARFFPWKRFFNVVLLPARTVREYARAQKLIAQQEKVLNLLRTKKSVSFFRVKARKMELMEIIERRKKAEHAFRSAAKRLHDHLVSKGVPRFFIPAGLFVPFTLPEAVLHLAFLYNRHPRKQEEPLYIRRKILKGLSAHDRHFEGKKAVGWCALRVTNARYEVELHWNSWPEFKDYVKYFENIRASQVVVREGKEVYIKISGRFPANGIKEYAAAVDVVGAIPVRVGQYMDKYGKRHRY
ncbi:MAG: hypothetical protein HY393_03795 [Candidatus Diapherotrites archaeon]|nr:hypothetical protein [Candidatus Diapherotrites archaeon]